jgi:hypothetical protein
MRQLRALIFAGLLLALAASIAHANDPSLPKVGQRKVTVRVRDTVIRAATTPIPGGSYVGTVAFYVDGKLAPASGVGSDCRVDYLTGRGVVIRLDVCGKGDRPVRIRVANVGAHPHRVTVRLRFVV